jgi:uncharacterized membrane protein YbhN (UPF0104 family)
MIGPDPGATGYEALSEAGRLKRWARPLLRVAALAFVIVAARDLALRWGDSKVELAPGAALLACVPLLLSCIVQGFAWIALVERMAGRSVPRGPALSLYLASQLARYTPGKVGLPLVRMEGAPRLSLAPSLVGISVLVEMLSWTATGAMLGFALLAGTSPSAGLGGLFGRLSVPLFAGAALGLLGLLVVDRSRYPARVRKLLAPDGRGPIVPLGLPLVQFAYWALVALHGYLMSVALGANGSAAVTAMGFYVIASVAGFVVLAAPAGLGVREAVLLAGLGPSIGAASALGAALISRAASLVVEVVAWLVVRGVFGGPKPVGSASR